MPEITKGCFPMTKNRCQQIGELQIGELKRRAEGYRSGTPGQRGAGRLPLRQALSEQRVEFPLPIRQGVQLLPVTSVIRRKLAADRLQLGFQPAYI